MKNSKTEIGLLAFVAALLFIFKIQLAKGDFWIDEIWSFNLTNSINRFSEIFSQLKIDNNHLLNTAYLFLLGNQENWMYYRLLSIVSGSFSFILIYFILREKGRLSAWVGAILFAASLPMNIYSTEARGYAPAIFFTLLSYFTFIKYLKHNKNLQLILFWIAISFAMISNILSLLIYISFLIYHFIFLFNNKTAKWFLHLVKTHSVPLILIVILYFGFYSQIEQGGSNVLGKRQLFLQLIQMFIGSNKLELIELFLFFFGLTSLLIMIQYNRLFTYSKDQNNLFLTLILIVSPLIILTLNWTYTQPRHFILVYPFLLILLCENINFKKPYNSKTAIRIIFIVLFLFVNIQNDVKFSRINRGHYLDALTYISKQSASDEIIVGSDHDFRNEMIIEFYQKYFEQKTFKYSDIIQSPDWYIVHSLNPDYQAKTHMNLNANNYNFVKSYPFYGYSGFGWYLYKKD